MRRVWFAVASGLVALLATVSFAQPAFTLLMASDANDGSGGVYVLNTATNTPTKIWPQSGAVRVRMAQYSPNGTQIACGNGNNLVIMGNDGSNPRVVSLSVPFNGGFGGSEFFAWTEGGIFWINRNRDTNVNRFFRYDIDADQLTEYPQINSKPNSTSFAGLFASTDGRRMYSWLTVDRGGGQEGKPFIFFDDTTFSTPRIEYRSWNGHNHAMRPDGRAMLAIGWEFNSSINPNSHPYLWTYELDNLTQSQTYQHGLSHNIQDMDFKGLIAIANESDWVCLTTVQREHFVWRYASAAPVRVNFSRNGWLVQHGWLGDLPSASGGVWQITESSLRLDEEVSAGSFVVTGWTDAADPVVSSSREWAGSPTIERSGNTVTITYGVVPETAPLLRDSAVITIRDAAMTARTARIIWTPAVSPAQRLAIQTVVTETEVTLSWENTLGTQFGFGVQKQEGDGWGPLHQTALFYTDVNPVNGQNEYRVVAISGTDTSYQEVGVTFVAPPSIRITSPAAGQTFAPGERITVQWEVVNVGSVEIRMSTDDGENFGENISPTTLTVLSYEVTLPDRFDAEILIRVNQYQSLSIFDSVPIRTSPSSVVARAVLVHAAQWGGVTYTIAGQRIPGGQRSGTGVVLVHAPNGGGVRRHVGIR